jgi:hypothetical protein
MGQQSIFYFLAMVGRKNSLIKMERKNISKKKKAGFLVDEQS